MHPLLLQFSPQKKESAATAMKMPYLGPPGPPSAAISIKASVPAKILAANHIEMNQAKMPDIMRIARYPYVRALCIDDAKVI